jgi:hypothetical protein
MSQKKLNEKFLLLTVFLLLLATVHSTSSKSALDPANGENDLVVGPGLPGPEGMVYWYVPDNLKDNKFDPSPYFPAISKYSDFMNYTRRTTMTVWYFNEQDELEDGEKELCAYLKEHGEVFSDNVDITEEVQKYGNSGPILGSTNLSVTRYESVNTSGYFAVIVKPFLDRKDDYFIIYYGTNEKSLDEESDTIKKLIAKEYYMGNKNGIVRELNYCATDKTIESKNYTKTGSKNMNSMGIFGSLIIMFIACFLNIVDN